MMKYTRRYVRTIEMLTGLKHVTIFIYLFIILYVRPLTYMAPHMPTKLHNEGAVGICLEPLQSVHFVAICRNVFTFNR